MTGPIRDRWVSDDGAVTLLLGDCLSVLSTFEEDTFDAIVTDPPAGIGFMGKEWDDFGRQSVAVDAKRTGILNCVPGRGGQPADVAKYRSRARDAFIDFMTAVAFEMFAVLKPGGHALVWALPRTSHWTATAMEDAGFEVRDRVSHLFGSGFPKSLDVSKAIDKAAGAERESGPLRIFADGTIAHGGQSDKYAQDTWTQDKNNCVSRVTAPATEAAKQWNGWGTALKPACEDWWLVRKPLSEKTVAANVLRWGTGALNIDGCRVESEGNTARPPLSTNKHAGWRRPWNDNEEARFAVEARREESHDKRDTLGRWPANVTHDGSPEVVEGFPQQASGGTPSSRQADKFRNTYGSFSGCEVENGIGSSQGSAARFFYCAKASRSDRGQDNKHPTVKNTELMRWLCRLITPLGGTILDCFLGSGSTAVAARREGFKLVGIEAEQEYFKTATQRCMDEACPPLGIRVTKHRKPDTRQQPLFQEPAL